jgi:hypothetical protein
MYPDVINLNLKLIKNKSIFYSFVDIGNGRHTIAATKYKMFRLFVSTQLSMVLAVSGYATLITGDEEKTTFSDLVHALGVIFNLCSH